MIKRVVYDCLVEDLFRIPHTSYQQFIVDIYQLTNTHPPWKSCNSLGEESCAELLTAAFYESEGLVRSKLPSISSRKIQHPLWTSCNVEVVCAQIAFLQTCTKLVILLAFAIPMCSLLIQLHLKKDSATIRQ